MSMCVTDDTGQCAPVKEFLPHKNKRTKVMQHIKAKTIKNVFRTKSNKNCILATKFDFAMTNENAYNLVDILGYRP